MSTGLAKSRGLWCTLKMLPCPLPLLEEWGEFFLWYLLWEPGRAPGDKYYNAVGSTLQLDSFGVFKLSELCILDLQQFIIGSCGRFLPRVSALVSHDTLYLAFCLSDLGYPSSLCVLPSLSNLGWLFSLFRFSLVRMDGQLLSFLLEVAETIFKMKNKGFAGGSVIKKTPANAVYTVSIPGPGISCMPQSNQTCASQLLNLCSRAHVPQLLKPTGPRACALQQEKPPQWEALTLQLESKPCSLQLEKKPTQQQIPRRAKNK